MAHAAQACYLLGTIQAQRDPIAAERAYLLARALAERHEMRPLEADCWWGLAELERRLGRPGAHLTLDRARALFVQLGLNHRGQPAST